MAKGDAASVKSNIGNLQNQINSGWESNKGLWGDQYNKASVDMNSIAPTVTGGYTSLANKTIPGGIDSSNITNMGAAPKAGYSDFANNGGLSPAFNAGKTATDSRFNDLNGAVNTGISDFQSIYSRPVSSDNTNQILANGAFQNFSNTGGFSPADLQSIRSRSMAPLRSTYANTQDELDRTGELSNGYSPNIAASKVAAARNEGAQANDQALNTESAIAQMVQSGKQFGASGLSGAGSTLGSLNLQGKLGGAQGVASTAISAQQTQIAKQNADLAVQQLDDQMKLAGNAGLTDIEKTQLNAELMNQQMNQQGAAATGSQQLSALGGLSNIQGLDAQTMAQLRNLFQGSTTNQFSNLLDLNGQRINATQIPSDFSQGLGNIGGVLGLVGQVGSAFSGLGGIKNGMIKDPGIGSNGVPNSIGV